MQKTVRMLGTHGVPASYGGFETAVENVSRYLVSRGWRVVVYCQVEGRGAITDDVWEGIERVIIPVPGHNWVSNSHFDLRSIVHAVRFPDLCVTFGYNTAIFNLAQRLRGIPNIINMDGIEWNRAKWGPLQRLILWTNEKIARRVGTHLIADHPVIARYHARVTGEDRITTIAYGAPRVEGGDEALVRSLGLEPGKYFSLIARPVPENSVLEIVRAFSRRRRDCRLAVLGMLDDRDPYHRAIRKAAGDEVSLLGAIYDPSVVQSLRFHSIGYLHGHTVGGTNPSLVEALGAGNAVIAHDNPYNRWVAGDAALWFSSVQDVDRALTRLLEHPDEIARLSAAARKRHEETFTWDAVAARYEQLLLRYLPGGS